MCGAAGGVGLCGVWVGVMSGRLDDAAFTMMILAIMVKRLGGEVRITQTDLDDIAFGRLLEHDSPTGGFLAITYEQRTPQ